MFAVETYPTLLQMTSTVTADARGRARPGRRARRRSSPAARSPARRRSGRWRSSPGSKPRRAAPIAARSAGLRRTAMRRSMSRSGPWCCRRGERVARLGLGSAIVADSDAGGRMARMPGEGRVCGDVRAASTSIETMRFDPDEGIAELDRHLARMKASAEALDFRFDRHDARNDLQAATFRARAAPDPAGALAARLHGDRGRAAAGAAGGAGRGRARPACRSRPTISACATRPATAPFTTRRAPLPAPSRSCSPIPTASSPRAASPLCSSNATASC